MLALLFAVGVEELLVASLEVNVNWGVLSLHRPRSEVLGKIDFLSLCSVPLRKDGGKDDALREDGGKDDAISD